MEHGKERDSWQAGQGAWSAIWLPACPIEDPFCGFSVYLRSKIQLRFRILMVT